MATTLDLELLTTMLINELENMPYTSFVNTIPLYDIPTTTTLAHEYRYRNLLNTNMNELETIINNSFNEKPIYKQVICDEELEKLINSKRKYTLNDIDNTCPITQTEFEEQQEIITLECNHCFDSAAIIHWLTEEKSECPVCRCKYKSKEVKIVEKKNEQEQEQQQEQEHQQEHQQQQQQEQQDLQNSRDNLYNSLSRVNFSSFFLEM